MQYTYQELEIYIVHLNETVQGSQGKAVRQADLRSSRKEAVRKSADCRERNVKLTHSDRRTDE